MSDKTHLPVVGTTAGVTDFVSCKLEHDDGSHLYLDGNQKISGWAPVPNAFSLRAQSVTDREATYGKLHAGAGRQGDCPGSTETCRAACYVGGLEKHQRAIYDLYEHNSDAVRAILTTGGGYMIDWADRLAEHIDRNCADVGFRWHVSGDVFSAKYARWIAEVVMASPSVKHWIYTRSFDFVGDMETVSTTRGGNLAINLSADRDNFDAALATAKRYGLRICYMPVTLSDPIETSHMYLLRDGDVIFPDYPIRPKSWADPLQHPWWLALGDRQRRMCCPVDAFGKSEQRRCGVCTKCF